MAMDDRPCSAPRWPRRRAFVAASALALSGSVPAWASGTSQRRAEIGAFQAVRAELAATVILAPAAQPGVAIEADLRCNDAAGLEARGLELQALRVVANGSGTMRLAGRCQRLALEAAGSGDVFATALAAQDAQLKARGSATVEVAAAVSLEVVVADAATVRYKGKPRITQKVGDVGTLEPL